jgi:hypothetical protein
MKMFLVVFVLIASVVHAKASGYNVGNGGDVLICERETGLPEVALLDLAELKLRYDLILTPTIEAGTSRDEILSLLFSRIEQRFPAYAQNLRSLYVDFWSLAEIVNNKSIPSLRDEGLYLQVDGCSLQQIAINFTDPTRQMKYKYIIDGALWKKISVQEQALLVIHELIYRQQSVKSGSSFRTSEHIRKLVALLASDSFDDPKYREFLNQQFGAH